MGMGGWWMVAVAVAVAVAGEERRRKSNKKKSLAYAYIRFNIVKPLSKRSSCVEIVDLELTLLKRHNRKAVLEPIQGL